jgi:hypothetical protein
MTLLDDDRRHVEVNGAYLQDVGRPPARPAHAIWVMRLGRMRAIVRRAGAGRLPVPQGMPYI